MERPKLAKYNADVSSQYSRCVSNDLVNEWRYLYNSVEVTYRIGLVSHENRLSSHIGHNKLLNHVPRPACFRERAASIKNNRFKAFRSLEILRTHFDIGLIVRA